MTARLMIDGDKWCFLEGENLREGVAGFGATIRDAQTDFNRIAAYAIRKPALLGDETRARYRLSRKDFEFLSVRDFKLRHELHGRLMREHINQAWGHDGPRRAVQGIRRDEANRFIAHGVDDEEDLV